MHTHSFMSLEQSCNTYICTYLWIPEILVDVYTHTHHTHFIRKRSLANISLTWNTSSSYEYISIIYTPLASSYHCIRKCCTDLKCKDVLFIHRSIRSSFFLIDKIIVYPSCIIREQISQRADVHSQSECVVDDTAAAVVVSQTIASTTNVSHIDRFRVIYMTYAQIYCCVIWNRHRILVYASAEVSVSKYATANDNKWWITPYHY